MSSLRDRQARACGYACMHGVCTFVADRCMMNTDGLYMNTAVLW